MKKISIVVAENNMFQNSGMASVDYSAYNFFKSAFPNASIKLFSFGVSNFDYFFNIKVDTSVFWRYEKIDNRSAYEISNSDLIIFWGDFLHTKHYLEQDFSRAHSGHDLLNLYYETIFLAGRNKKVLSKTLVFGNSMMFVGPEDFHDLRYRTNFQYFFHNVHKTWTRDPVSLQNLLSLSNANASAGCDSAFLLKNKTQARKENKLGVFIGDRTKISPSVISFVKRTAAQKSLSIEWIPWMANQLSTLDQIIDRPMRAPNLLAKKYLANKYSGHTQGDCPVFFSLKKYSLIITDTYHVCVNAMRDNVPVIGLGSDGVIYDKQALTLHDKKKEVLFEMYGLNHHYFNIDDLKEKNIEYNITGWKFPGQEFNNNVYIDLLNHCIDIIGD